MSSAASICVVGIGNPLRGDDGVGAELCRLLSGQDHNGVSIITVHQLDMGLAETLASYEQVVFADASLKTTSVIFSPLAATGELPQSFSHHVNPALLAALVEKLYPGKTEFYVCEIGISEMGMCEGLSAIAQANVRQAVELLSEWINSKVN